MILSLNWLRRYVDLSGIPPEKIADDLTMTTAEIEDVRPFGDALSDIVVGRVTSCERHPDADKLFVARVDAGDGDPLSIVCGANNVAAGQKIALAKIGVRLADGTKIKKSKIRGQVSRGMICSERELGLSSEHEGILVLDPSFEAGTPLTEVLPIRDTVFSIDNKSITHRPDLWGHYGFARELAAIYGRELGSWLEGREARLPEEGETLPVDIGQSDGRCVVYNGLVMREVAIAPAPEWMRYLLLSVGQRPLNNIVDLTNFLLHDLGQPMHAFDLERLRGSRIVVRTARDGEAMVTLDNVERRLCREDLLICDGEGPVALAGIMGGEGSMVSEETRDVFLESANFAAASIRRSSVRLGLRTDSSTRFEKSLDPAVAALAARKFAALLPEVAPGAVVAGPLSEPSGWSFPGREIRLRLGRAGRVLGVPLEENQVRSFLEPLGFAVGESSGDEPSFLVSIPSWRATKDIEIEEDLIEEIGRRYGYDNIEARAPLAPVRAAHREEELRVLRHVQEILARDLGYFEAFNYSFLSDELTARLGLEQEPYVTVTNAIAAHMSRVRRDVLPSLLGSLRDNLRREEAVALFEVGKGYRPERTTELERGRLPYESHQVVAVAADTRPGSRGRGPSARVRGHLDHLLRCLGRSTLTKERMDSPPVWMHPGRTAVLKHPEDPDDVVAYVGELHPCTLDALELPLSSESGGAAAFCLDLRALLRVPEDELCYRPVPKFPEQPIDLAFLAAESLEVGSLTALLYEASPKLVRDVRLFEVYRDRKQGGIAEGMKSLNFTVVLGSEQRTLTTGDEEKYIRKVREAARSLGAELRG